LPNDSLGLTTDLPSESKKNIGIRMCVGGDWTWK